MSCVKNMPFFIYLTTHNFQETPLHD